MLWLAQLELEPQPQPQPQPQPGMTIHTAAQIGDLESLHGLLASPDANAEELDRFGTPALCCAAAHGQADCLLALLDAGASGAATSHSGGSALHLAARNGHLRAPAYF